MDPYLGIFVRWVHVFTACVLVGGVVFMRVIVPLGLGSLDPVPQREVYLRFRRAFKMVLHTAIVLLVASGAYNAWRNWPAYAEAAARPWGHGLFGVHVLLAAGAFAVGLVLTAGKQPPRWHRGGMALAVVLAVLIVAAGSGMKWARERALAGPGAAAPVAAQAER